MGDEAGGVGRRDQPGIADRGPEQPPGGVGEAGDRIPGGGGAARHADLEPAVPGEVLELGGAHEDLGVEAALGIPADVLDALRELRVEGLAPDGVSEHGALAPGREPLDEPALEIRALRRPVVGERHQAPVETLDGLARGRVRDGGCLEQVGVEPSLLEPGGREGTARADRVRGQEALEIHLLDGYRPGGRARGSGLDGLARSLGEVPVLEVVGVIGRDRVWMRDVTGARGAQALAGARGGGAAGRGVGRGRVEARHQVAAERVDGGHVGGEPAAREGIATDIGVERAVPEERHRGGR
jgi:hypothetical protein